MRTPLTYDRALLEVALADPVASAAELRETCQELLASGEQQERLIDALLTLASSEPGLERRQEFDLAAVTARAISQHRASADDRGLQVSVALHTAATTGDPDLAERMAANLVDNAIRYNRRGGHVEVSTETREQLAILTVANTGAPVKQDQASRLFQPFQRLSADRASHPEGHGLGLSIVRAIAAAHDARLKVQLPADGGLSIEAQFPARNGADRRRHPATAYDATTGTSVSLEAPIRRNRRAHHQEADDDTP